MTQEIIEKCCLWYQPFEGDDVETTTFQNKMVNTRKPHTCHICDVDIKPQSRCRALTEKIHEDNKLVTFYFCPICCRAMAKTEQGLSEREIDYRYGLGDKRRAKRREGGE